MKKKLGPLPVWAWALIGAGVVAFLYFRSSSSSSSSSSQLNQVDPNNPLGLTYAQENADIAAGIDPNTGQTYASEQAAADQSAASSGGGSGTTDTTGTTGDDLSGFLTTYGELQSAGLIDQGAQTPAQTFAGEIADVTGAIGALQASGLVPTPPTAAPAGGSSGGASGSSHPVASIAAKAASKYAKGSAAYIAAYNKAFNAAYKAQHNVTTVSKTTVHTPAKTTAKKTTTPAKSKKVSGKKG